MSKEVAALLLTLVVHVIGAAALVGALMHGSAPGSWRSWWPTDEDDEGRGGQGREEPPKRPSPSDGGLPLPDAVPAAVRLREPGRLADAHPRPARRGAPERAPSPAHTAATRD